MAYGSGNSNIKMTPLSLTDANAWRDVLGWEINDGGASVDVGMAYSAVGWVNRCVHLRAGALKELPWSLMKGDSEIANSESEDYSFLPWLESLPDLLYLAESALCITGTAYIGKVRNRGKRIEDLRWFAPSTMEPIWSPVDGLIGYKRTIGSTGGNVSVQPWSIENIIYFHILNPLHETEPGASPVAAALLDAQVIYNLNQYSSLFFQRGAIKPTLLTVEGMPPPAERERLKAWWQRAFSGVKNAFNTEIISASVKPIVVGEGLEALNNNSLTEEKREAISTALGVPHSMVMSNASNFATAEADRLNLYDTTIIPRAKTIANSLNRQLFTELGYRIVFKPESLSIYQEDEEQRAGALVQLVNAGMKLSVAAEILGIGLPDGVTYESLDEAKQQADAAQQALLDAQLAKQQQNNTSSDNAQDASQPKANAADNTHAKTKEAAQFRKWLKKRDNADIHMFKAEYLTHDELHEIADDVREVATEQPFFTLPETFTRESVKALLLMNPDDDEAEQKIRMELERRSARNIDKAFTEMVNTLYPAGYDGFGGAFIDPNIEASRIQRAFREEQALRDAVSRALIDSADLGVSIGIAQLEGAGGIGFDYLLAHTAARDFAISYTDTLLEQMAATSGKLVGSTVARWFENREPLEQLIQDLEPVFGRKRAERIAATEVTRAAAEGSRLSYIESGVVEKVQWRTSRDERTCPVCAPLEGKQAGLDGNFGGVSVPAHPNCILPGNVVFAPGGIDAMAKSFYVGRCIEITLSDGSSFSITENHPVLTINGFVPAKFINKGMNVFSTITREWKTQTINPHNNYMPSTIEKVFDSFVKSGNVLFASVPSSAEYLHGDGVSVNGNIDIVYSNRFLLNDRVPKTNEIVSQNVFTNRRSISTNSFFSNSSSNLTLNGVDSIFGGYMGICQHCGSPITVGHNPSSNHTSGAIPWRNASVFEPTPEHVSINASLTTEGFFGLSRNIPVDESDSVWMVNFSSDDGNVVFPKDSSNNIVRYTKRTSDFLRRFTGDVSINKVVSVREFDFSGHVYDLQSDMYELYICNGAIVKNCRCWLVPVV